MDWTRATERGPLGVVTTAYYACGWRVQAQYTLALLFAILSDKSLLNSDILIGRGSVIAEICNHSAGTKIA